VIRRRDLAPATVTAKHSTQALQNTYWSLINSGTSIERVKDKGLRNWLISFDHLQKFSDRSFAMQTEFYSNVAEYGSWLLPVGELILQAISARQP